MSGAGHPQEGTAEPQEGTTEQVARPSFSSGAREGVVPDPSFGSSSPGYEGRLAERAADGPPVAGEVAIRPELVTSPVARRLLEAYVSELDRRWPGGFAPEATDPTRPEAFCPPEGVFFVAWVEEVPVGCGGVRRLAAGVGEVKRMWVSPAVRGRGIGRALLEALERGARGLGCGLLRLDTTSDLRAAVHLYRSAGYREIPPYNGNAYADLWFEKALAPPPAADPDGPGRC